jgi:ABC-type transport system substrate-binding protein
MNTTIQRSATTPLLAFILLWLACPLRAAEAPARATPKRGGTLRLATDDDPFSLDPLQLWSNHAAALSFLVFNSLLEQRPDGSFVPVLAEAMPDVSADGLAYTFRLHPGVRFSNGRALVADDVVYSFERGCDPTVATSANAFYRNIVGSAEFGAARAKEAAEGRSANGDPTRRRIEPTTVAGLRALDRRRFQLRLKAPDLTAFSAIAPNGIVPHEEVNRKGRGFGTHPVGTGSFVLKEWVRGVRMRFERNPNGFRPEAARLDAVVVMLNVDMTTQAMMIDRREIDFMFFLADPDVHRWRKDARMRQHLVTFKGSSPSYITLNCELPPFTNRLVRQALNHAVNKDAIVKKLLNRAVAARGPLPTNVRGYNPNLAGYAYDPVRAEALLAEAGYPNGFATTLWSMPNDKIALSVQEDLRAVGVRVEMHWVSWPTLMESMQRRRTVPMGSMNGPASDEPKDVLDFLLNGDNITDEGSGNMAFYSNPEVQRLLRQASVATEEAPRIRLYQQIEELIVQDAPWIFACHGDMEMFCQPWLKGVRMGAVWPPVHLENCWLER